MKVLESGFWVMTYKEATQYLCSSTEDRQYALHNEELMHNFPYAETQGGPYTGYDPERQPKFIMTLSGDSALRTCLSEILRKGLKRNDQLHRCYMAFHHVFLFTSY